MILVGHSSSVSLTSSNMISFEFVCLKDRQQAPFVPRERLFEKQKLFQNIHKHTHLKGPYDRITLTVIPLVFAASSLYLIGRGIYNMSHGHGIEKKELEANPKLLASRRP